jgi:hypothetical protein
MNKMRNLLVVIAGLMLAVTAQPSSASDFCSETATGQIEQLAGIWVVSHGTGMATAAGMIIPYRSPNDTVIDFEYMPEIGVIFATGVTEAGEMLIVPSPSDVEEMASVAIGNSLENGSPDSCGGSAMPVIVGTSNYPNFEQVEGNYGPTACETMYTTMTTLATLDAIAADSYPSFYPRNNPACGSVENTLQSGGMVMRMVVRFSDASSGSGYLTFDGQADGATFQAYTPITLSRN